MPVTPPKPPSPVRSNGEQPYGLHWFRRDLRLIGNPALSENARRMSGRVLGVFCFDAKFLSRPDFSANRFGFFLKTLGALAEELRAGGGDLICLDEGPSTAFPVLFSYLQSTTGRIPATISFNRDYEPFARDRDAMMSKQFAQAGVDIISCRDHLVIEPGELERAAGGGPYRVFTPFAKRWQDLLSERGFSKRVWAPAGGTIARSTSSNNRDAANDGMGSSSPSPRLCLKWPDVLGARAAALDRLADLTRRNTPRVTVPLPAAGSTPATLALQDFRKRIDDYGHARDFPERPATSGLSIFLKNGTLTTAQIVQSLGLRMAAPNSDRHKFLTELIWREFYYHILYHFPEVETEAFQAKYRNLIWPGRDEWFTAWTVGLTGFPIVDAGMRQLKTTGWMHNRVRMIVASFLSKDLLIDWRRGERYFMEQLLDGDLAPNNGGWQWSASTGCDAQPYFRIFNPWLQSKRFDPDGGYIRRYVPELRDCPSPALHNPKALRPGYPRPIVIHATQRKLALQLYRSAEPV